MRIFVFGENKSKIEQLVSRYDSLKLVTKNPDLIIAYGGDGTLMQAEYRYPGIPKILLKNSRVAKKADSKENRVAVEKIAKEEFYIDELWKLEARAKGKTIYALNDIVVHNQDPRHAIRYTVAVNGKQLGGEIIGDGIVFATPFGSTAYFRSITDSYFEVGLGVAFNNSTEQADHIILKEDRVVRVRIIRGPALCYADNQEKLIPLAEGESVQIRKSAQKAKLVRLKV